MPDKNERENEPPFPGDKSPVNEYEVTVTFHVVAKTPIQATESLGAICRDIVANPYSNVNHAHLDAVFPIVMRDQ